MVCYSHFNTCELLHFLSSFTSFYASATNIILQIRMRGDVPYGEGLDLVDETKDMRILAVDTSSDGFWYINLEEKARDLITEGSNEALKQLIQSFE